MRSLMFGSRHFRLYHMDTGVFWKDSEIESVDFTRREVVFRYRDYVEHARFSRLIRQPYAMRKDVSGRKVYDGDVVRWKKTSWIVRCDEKTGDVRFCREEDPSKVEEIPAEENLRIMGNIFDA